MHGNQTLPSDPLRMGGILGYNSGRHPGAAHSFWFQLFPRGRGVKLENTADLLVKRPSAAPRYSIMNAKIWVSMEGQEMESPTREGEHGRG